METPTHQSNPTHGHGHRNHEHGDGMATVLELDGAVTGTYLDLAIDQIRATLGREPAVIIDLGAGTGTGTRALARRFPDARIVAVDADPEMTARVAADSHQVRTLVANLDDGWPSALTSPSDVAQADIIWASSSLHHLADPEQLLMQARDRLSPGGVLAVIEMTGPPRLLPDDIGIGTAGLHDRITAAMSSRGWKAFADWTTELSAAGFTAVRIPLEVTLADPPPQTIEYAQEWLSRLRVGLADVLGADDLATLAALTSADHPAAIARRTDLLVESSRLLWIAKPHANDVDVAIIGGGPAGLGAAVALSRSLRSVAVLDTGHPRNAPAAGAHNLLGREGIAPADLLHTGRAEALHYGTQIRPTEATSVTREERDGDTSFIVQTGDATQIRARRLLLATGLVDDLPEIAGLTELWGTDVLHCPYCHGFEVRGKRIGVLGTGPMAMHQTLLFRQLSSQITLIGNGMPELTDDERRQLAALGIPVVDGPVARVQPGPDGRLRSVQFTDGRELEVDALVVAPRMVVRGGLYESLGGQLADNPMGQFIPTELMGRTPITGVWAAGNSADLSAMVGASAAAGMQAGAAINADLVQADALAALSAEQLTSPAR